MKTKELLERDFIEIKNNLNKALVGQYDLVDDLCNYFSGKLEENYKGTIFILGEKDTGKRMSIQLLFEELESFNLIGSSEISEINLRNYNFNLGYNAFLTDLYKALNSNSEVVVFRNFDSASEKMLKIISNVYPNSCLTLEEDYIIKNDFLIEAKGHDEEGERIRNFICHSKFFVFLSYKDDLNLDTMFSKSFIDQIDKVLYTKPLNKEERAEVIRRNLEKSFNNIDEIFNVDIKISLDKRKTIDKDIELSNFLQESYKEDKEFGITEFVNYKIDRPLRNLINKEKITSETTIVIYIDNEEIYCHTVNGTFKLSDI